MFGNRRAVQVTTADVTAYVDERARRRSAKNATINRELAALKRAYSLALAAERIHRHPNSACSRRTTSAQGFFEREQFEAVRAPAPRRISAAS